MLISSKRTRFTLATGAIVGGGIVIIFYIKGEMLLKCFSEVWIEKAIEDSFNATGS